MHIHHYVTAANKLPVDENLWNSRPLSVVFDPLPDILILKDIDGVKVVNAVETQDLHNSIAEPAPWLIGRPLHEDGDGLALHQTLDVLLGPGLAGEPGGQHPKVPGQGPPKR